MKILFWLLAIVSILTSLFVSFISWLSEGLGLYHSIMGHIFCYIGMVATVVSIICVVLGGCKLRKGDAKKAILLALVGLIYAGAVMGVIFIEEAVDTVRMDKDTAAHNEQMYGEGWDELLIATTAPTEAGGTAFFCMYSDPANRLTLDVIPFSRYK